MNKTTKSRIAKKTFHKTRIKPWMVSVFIGLIMVVGIFVIYNSFAASLPQSIIDEAMANLVINPDGTSTVSVPSLNYKKTFSQADTVRAGIDPNFYNQLMAKVIEELTVLYNKKYPPTTPPPNTPAPTQPSPVQPKPNTPAPNQPTQNPNPSQNPSTNPSQNPSQSPSSPTEPGTAPSGNIESQDKAKEAIESLQYDLQDPSTMPTYSRIAGFTLTPIENLSSADTVGVYVDRRLVKAIKPSAREFNIDTTRLENGVHRLDVVVYDKSDTPLARYVFMFKSENNLNLFDRAISAVSSPFASLFGW